MDDAIYRLAEKIAASLFTPYNSEQKATHLRLYLDNEYLCGWGEKPMADHIEKILRADLTPAPSGDQQ